MRRALPKQTVATPVRASRLATLEDSPLRRSPRVVELKRRLADGLSDSPSKKGKGIFVEEEVEVKRAPGKAAVKIEPGEATSSPSPIPQKLRKFWDVLLKEYPHEQYGPYEFVSE
jgi:hypothetical protein